MHTIILDQAKAYSGKELRSHWIYSTQGVQGDAAIAFQGPCEVKLTEMVDLADVHAQSPIYSEQMLHIIIEHFQASLHSMVLRQRLLTAQIQTLLDKHGAKNLIRSNDDLYDEGRKLTVSIATVSPVSGLIHFGINISSNNTPVPTRGLNDYKINWHELAKEILNTYDREESSIQQALTKVRWVH